MLGTLYTDTLTLSDGVMIHEQSIGVGSGINHNDGILGLGPVALTANILVDEPDTLIPTVIDNLLEQGDISQHVVNYFFVPSTEEEVSYGLITFGGIDPDDPTGPITYM